jgi:hypothetical protein
MKKNQKHEYVTRIKSTYLNKKNGRLRKCQWVELQKRRYKNKQCNTVVNMKEK